MWNWRPQYGPTTKFPEISFILCWMNLSSTWIDDISSKQYPDFYPVYDVLSWMAINGLKKYTNECSNLMERVSAYTLVCPCRLNDHIVHRKNYSVLKLWIFINLLFHRWNKQSPDAYARFSLSHIHCEIEWNSNFFTVFNKLYSTSSTLSQSQFQIVIFYALKFDDVTDCIKCI